MNEEEMNRRHFLGSSGVAGAGLALAGLPFSRQARAASDTIRVGIIGPGGRGTRLLGDCIEFGSKYNARITGICDIWESRRLAAAKRVTEAYGVAPKVYRRMEEVLGDKDIDAVIIATADHQHAKMLEAAVKAGKDVYCEKPMANVLSEANATLAAVENSGRVVQIGTQGRSHPKCRAAAGIIRKGMIGDLVKVTLCENEYSPYRWAPKKSELEALRESDVDWPAFLLSKPKRPFDSRIYLSFRLFREFSSGIFDQWMSHDIDTCHFLTGEPYPRSAVAQGGIYQWRDYRENPDTVQAVFEYGEGNKKFLATYSCCLVNGSGTGYRVQGTLGTLEFDKSPLNPDGKWRVSGDGVKREDALKEAQDIADQPGTMHHMANWLDCVRRRDRATYCPVEAGYGHSIACVMATDALWSGRRMVFDPARKGIRAG